MATHHAQTQLEQMLQRGQSGEPQFAEALVRQHYAGIHRLARSILGDEQDAQDAAQETFVAALLHIERFQPGTSLKAWLAGIAVHKCQAILRKRKTRQALGGALQAIHSLFERSSSVVETVIQHETHAGLWEAVHRLDEKHRLPVILFYLYDLPVKEIAAILKISPGTVNSRLHYALEKLKGYLSLQETLPGKRLTPGAREIDR